MARPAASSRGSLQPFEMKARSVLTPRLNADKGSRCSSIGKPGDVDDLRSANQIRTSEICALLHRRNGTPPPPSLDSLIEPTDGDW